MKELLTSLLALGLGLQHGLGADHLAAVTTLVSKSGDRARPLLLSISFGIGHSLTLLVLGGICLSAKLALSAEFERTAELLGGALLIGLGLWLLFDRRSFQAYLHSHEHVHGQIQHQHMHVHVSGKHRREHNHIHLATFLGGLFALSGLARLLVILPTVLLASSVGQGISYIVLFGIGIVLSMSAYGFILARFLKAMAPYGKLHLAISLIVAVTSIGVGIYWIVSRL